MNPNNDKFKEEKISENTRGKLYFMVGSARSGKSTISKKLAKELNAVIITPDSFRIAIYNTDYHYDSEYIVWSHVDVAARALLINGSNVLVDETNTMKWRRDHWLGLGGVGFYVNAPCEICLERCHKDNEGLRGAVRRMHQNLKDFDPYNSKEKIVRMYFTTDGKEYHTEEVGNG